jgi:hypothetical protein
MKRLTVFTVRRQTNGRLGEEGDIIGWGVRFPSGGCYIDWNQEAFPADQRLDHAHISVYGSLGDVKQASGKVVIEEYVPLPPWPDTPEEAE